MSSQNHNLYLTIIGILVIVTLVSLAVAIRNTTPVCDDLVRYPGDPKQELICEYSLGDIQADDANVIMRQER